MQEQEKDVMERARHDAEQGKSASTQAGEFVREEMHHIREGKHGAQSAEQAIAIGLSKARRAGVKLPVPKRGKGSSRTRAQAERDLRMGRRHPKHKPSKARSRSTSAALRREGKAAVGFLARESREAQDRRLVHADDSGQWRAEELSVTQDGSRMACLVLAGDEGAEAGLVINQR